MDFAFERSEKTGGGLSPIISGKGQLERAKRQISCQ